MLLVPLAFMRNKRTDNAGIDAPIFGDLLVIWEATDLYLSSFWGLPTLILSHYN